MKHLSYGLLIIIEAIIIIFLLILVVIILKKQYKNQKDKREQQNYRSIIVQALTALVNAIDAKDNYTSGHSIRVAKYSVEIARQLGMGKSFLENIYYIGLLHDVGKIGIPKEIINKPGKLTDDEFDTMKTHTSIGREILKNITAIVNIPIGAAEHHEHWDGNGYHKVKEDKISLEARIIAIADTYDAMSSDRSYRKALQKSIILEEFKKNSGRQFDPRMAPIIIEMIEQDQFNSINVDKILGFEQIYTVNSIGTHDNFDFELFKRDGDAEMILKGGGNFKCKWNNSSYVTMWTGRKFDESKNYSQIGNIGIKYDAKYYPKGNSSFLCVYGWSVEPLVLFMIIDNWYGNFGSDLICKGTVFLNSGLYRIYETTVINCSSIKGTQTFKIYYSVRTKKRLGGIISVTEHFSAWEKAGMDIGNLYEVAFGIFGNSKGSGKAEIYNYELTIGDTIIGNIN
ncbi:MAG: glycoside hydrolase family 11 protein [Treponema sp.]|nr:glycoside hydrolase family 11 protein [Treponema sp.]